MYTLYGIDESGSCMIEIALQRCAVPWRRVDAASWAEGEGSDELARINPLKQWRLNIPAPDEASSRYQAAIDDQDVSDAPIPVSNSAASAAQ